MRVGVLVSGAGTNLQALLDAERAGTLGATVALVVSNTPGAPALARAGAAGVPSCVLPRDDFRSREDQHAAIADALEAAGVGLVVCAGFNRILSAAFVERFRDRIINVHPSLLPAFGGGLHALRDALAHGAKIVGCTVHLVTEDVDAGPIVAQAAVPVLESDGESDLAARVQTEEHRLLPLAVRWFAEDRVRVDGRRTRIVQPAEAR